MLMALRGEADRCIVDWVVRAASMVSAVAVIGTFATNTGNTSIHQAMAASVRKGSERRMDGSMGRICRV